MQPTVAKLINRRAIGGTILLALVVYVVLGLSTEIGHTRSVWASLRWGFIGAVFGLSLVNYFIRFCNWQFYLSSIGIRNVRRLDSLLIFIGGFGMGITPGKVGEVVRSLLLKERYDIPISKTGSLVLVDRLTDVLALLLIGGIGMVQLRYGFKVFAVLALFALGLLVVLSSKRLSHALLRLLKRLPVLARHEEKLESLYDSVYTLLQPKRLWLIMLLSILSWSCEAVGFYLVFQALGIGIGMYFAFFIYSFSTLIGAVALLPGGLGLTEGSMTGLLVLLHVDKGAAAAATVLIRLATLWFGLCLGLLCLGTLESKAKKA